MYEQELHRGLGRQHTCATSQAHLNPVFRFSIREGFEQARDGHPKHLLWALICALLLDPQVAQMGNGFMAVIAGIVSQLSADYLGDIGPFQVICV
jgi:hypothetical protein